MEQIQKQKHHRKTESEIEPLPEHVDESELNESTSKVLGKIATVLGIEEGALAE